MTGDLQDEDSIVHLHDPKTGGHLCGADVPNEFRVTTSRHWSNMGNFIRVDHRLTADRSEDYLGGQWCCENSFDLVTCGRCKTLMNKKIRKMVQPRQSRSPRCLIAR